MPKEKFKTIDEYIARDYAPTAEEAISYQMPTFKLNGNLVWFAAFNNHIGFYPKPSAIETFREELSIMKCPKVPLDFL